MAAPGLVVIDTNVVLDLLLFRDPSTVSLSAALGAGMLRWLATLPMREELARVLVYSKIVAQSQRLGVDPGWLLGQFDHMAQLRPVPMLSSVRCSDPDDQPFVDLAVVHCAGLLSKDRQLLRLRQRLQAVGVSVRPTLLPAA